MKFGGDIVRQAMNRHELGTARAASPSAAGRPRSAAARRQTSSTTIAAFLLGLPTGDLEERHSLRERLHEEPQLAVQLLREGPMAADAQADGVARPALRLLPDGHAHDARDGALRPRDQPDADLRRRSGADRLRLRHGTGQLVAPGSAWRTALTEDIVVRGGYGINYDPYPLAFVRNILGNYPSSISSERSAAERAAARGPAGRRHSGHHRARREQRRHSGAAQRQRERAARRAEARLHPLVECDRAGGAALGIHRAGRYVGNAPARHQPDHGRQRRTGASAPAMPAVRCSFEFGRTGATGILSNPGWSDYDSLQTSLSRRLAQGLQMNVAYTWSKAFGICCDTLSDNPPQVQALEYFFLNEALLPQDRPHNFQASFVAELPFGSGKPFLNEGGVAGALLGGWQVNGLLSLYSGAPFTVTSSGTSLDHARQHAVRRPGERGSRDPGRHRTRPTLVRHDRRFAPSPSGGSAPPASTACGVPDSPTST